MHPGVLSAIAYWQVKELGERGEPEWRVVFYFSLTGAILGGLGSLPGTVIGAMLLGIIESLTATFYGPSWAPAVSFGFLLLTLAFRPSGLMGR